MPMARKAATAPARSDWALAAWPEAAGPVAACALSGAGASETAVAETTSAAEAAALAKERIKGSFIGFMAWLLTAGA
ncbi:hypothetical protein GCM10011617_04950 [Novosphingobium arvoryzae]|uniref:Uncharacterized protein n=1 Tax=Novosphingobium arvoryzae TaxID=1256514 RepID=A0A918R9S9_9SPHN|nr:hypothetical protein GCM10011617_04950 [Novosphingobium arvoryzae]